MPISWPPLFFLPLANSEDYINFSRETNYERNHGRVRIWQEFEQEGKGGRWKQGIAGKGCPSIGYFGKSYEKD